MVTHSLKRVLPTSGRVVVAALVLASCFLPVHTNALTQNQKDALGSGAYYFNTEDDSCTDVNAGTSGSSTAGTDTPKWVTTLQAPYSLEDFVVELLRDIAAKEKVPESSTVTQQHVLALVAFAQGEGGNLTNNDIYNPWNTGYIGADLQPVGNHSSSGLQSYGSFNDGVEATARVMTGTGGSNGYQTRLGTILSQPNTNAQDVMKTLTYYQDYPGNLAWAEASMPPKQESYYQDRLQLITSTQTNYNHIASFIIGPPGNSDSNNLHKPGALRYSFSGDTTVNDSTNYNATSADNCGVFGVGAVQGNLAQTAVNLAWDDYPNHSFNSKDPKPVFLDAKNQLFGSGDNTPDADALTDCGVFVATVVRSSGVDPNWNNGQIGSGAMILYAKAHPEKYTVLPGFSSTKDLNIGDILANSSHIYMYVGQQSDGKSVAEASHYDHVPEIDADPYPSQDGENFMVIRVNN